VTTQEYTLTINGDKIGEPDEWFLVNVELLDADSQTLAVNAGTITITNDDGEFLTASTVPEEPGTVEFLTEAQLAPIVDEAIERWAEALTLDESALSFLYAVDFEIKDFSGLTLGMAGEDTIFIDADAAGWGWFVDTTPADDLEFGLQLSEFELQALETRPAFGQMDLLTTVMHEFGHILGFEDLDPDSGYLMSETLDAGTRVLPAGNSGRDPLVNLDSSSSPRDETLTSALAGNHGSWLLDFLLNKNRGRNNPFDPVEEIQIAIHGNGRGKRK
jgi:hypothetical protein